MTPEVRAWLDKHPRFKRHYSLIRASWLSLVECIFAEITSRRIRRGSYSSVDDLEAAIYDYLAQHNAKPKALNWTRSAEYILAQERRALNDLDEVRANRAGVRLESLGRETIHMLVEAIHFIILIFAHGCVFQRNTTENRAMYFESPDGPCRCERGF